MIDSTTSVDAQAVYRIEKGGRWLCWDDVCRSVSEFDPRVRWYYMQRAANAVAWAHNCPNVLLSSLPVMSGAQ